jgi:hypothetical protein
MSCVARATIVEVAVLFKTRRLIVTFAKSILSATLIVLRQA